MSNGLLAVHSLWLFIVSRVQTLSVKYNILKVCVCTVRRKQSVEIRYRRPGENRDLFSRDAGRL